MNFSAEFAGLALTTALVLLAMVGLRNPHNPAWLRSEEAAHAASFVLVVLISMVFAWAVTGLTEAGLRIAAAMPIALAVIVISGAVLWFAFNVGERLRRADAGRSPFARIRPTHAHPKIRGTAH